MKSPVGWLLFVAYALIVMAALIVRRAGLEGKDMV